MNDRDFRNHRTLTEGGLVEDVLARIPIGLEKDFALLETLTQILRRNGVVHAANDIELWGRKIKRNLIGQDGKGRTETIDAIRGESGKVMPAEHAGANGNGTGPAAVIVNHIPGANGKPPSRPSLGIFGKLGKE